MADYNQNYPYVVGDQWVPIRQADYKPETLVEQGYAFHIDHGTTVVSGGWTVAELPPVYTVNTAIMQAIYAENVVDFTGPISQVTIPVDGVRVTGDAIVSVGVAPWLSANDNSQSFMFPDLGSGPTTIDDGFGLSFNLAGFSNELSNKRILNIELLYTVNGDPLDLARVAVSIARAWDSPLSSTQTFTYSKGMEGPPTEVANTRINSISFGSFNPFWSPNLTPASTSEVLPWRYDELALLDASSTPSNTKLQVSIQWADGLAPPLGAISFNYAALRITYCNENRILYGGRRSSEFSVASIDTLGLAVHRFANNSFTFGQTLDPGNYVITNTFEAMSTVPIVDDDSAGVNTQTPVTLAALRQLDEVPGVRGVRLQKSFTVNDEFSIQDSDVIPGIYLYTTAGIVTGSHAYSTQVAAPVYSGINADQDIGPFTGNASGLSFTQIRFFARRYGDNALPLNITFEPLSTNVIIFTITPEAFDALPEIIDGWREVTGTLLTTVSSGSTARTIRFGSASSSSNRWEVLGAVGSSAGTFSTGPASYEPPALGTTLELTWKAPNQSSATLDTNADATLMLATAGITVTGFAVTGSGCVIDLEPVSDACTRVTPGCVPTHILGNRVGWNVGSQFDEFARQRAALGNLDSGESWTILEGAASFWTTDGADAVLTVTGAGNMGVAAASPGAGFVDVAVSSSAKGSQIAAGDAFSAGVILRAADANNYYLAQVRFETTGMVTARMLRKVAGVFTQIGNLTGSLFAYNTDQYVNMEMTSIGSEHRLLVWREDMDKADAVSVLATDSSLTAAGLSGIFGSRFSSNTNTGLAIEFENFCAVQAAAANGTVEIQRMDDVDTDWATIALIPPCAAEAFCDFEARAGVESTYRLRLVNSADFPGPWSSEVSVVLASPGVSGVGDGNSTLMFTSNQDTSASLAYTMNWEGEAQENFTFPESGFQQLRTQYNRDFFVAFRPLERGGEQFSRTILVNAAAIPPESLADFRSLRDLAWADLPYVCVRDELGNRWFANVAVPNGRVRNNRQLYFAEIQVTEVTETPAPYTGE